MRPPNQLTSSVTNTGIVTINFDNPLLLPWYMNQAAVVVLTNTTVAPTATAAAPISCGRKCKIQLKHKALLEKILGID